MTIKLISQTLTSATTSAIGKPSSNQAKFEQRFLNFEVSGLTDSTVDIEVSLDGGDTFEASETYTADVTKAILHASPGAQYRFNVTIYGAGGDSIVLLLLN